VIYEYPNEYEPIRQGDIFVGLPRVEISLREVPILNEDESVVNVQWRDIAENGKRVVAVLPVRPVIAIVATQNCDALRARDITLCEIRPFRDVERKAAQTTSPKSWKNIITQHARINLKWFYLPPDERLGFTEKMGVDFLVTLRVPRVDLEELRFLRKGRLNRVGYEHFRERIAEFFRRYPYDEWYPLDDKELDVYRREYPDIEPFPWQRANSREESGGS
jgi:hypothetical protein